MGTFGETEVRIGMPPDIELLRALKDGGITVCTAKVVNNVVALRVGARSTKLGASDFNILSDSSSVVGHKDVSPEELLDSARAEGRIRLEQPAVFWMGCEVIDSSETTAPVVVEPAATICASGAGPIGVCVGRPVWKLK